MKLPIIFSIIIAIFIVFVYAEDYYKLLGVDRTATKKEIKKAFRELSKIHHPDKNGGDDAMYMKLNQAYDVLSDDEKRRIYDTKGEEGVRKHEQGGGSGGGGGFGFGSIFDSFFGGGGGGGRGGEQRGSDIIMDLSVTLKDLYLGKSIDIEINKQMLCPKCRGTGAETPDDIHECDSCGGSGFKTVRKQIAPGFVQQMQTTCDKCSGTGSIVDNHCHHCSGSKLVSEDTLLSVEIEKGMKDGQTILYEHEADQHPDMAAGHVQFVVKQIKHSHFTRKGDHLYVEVRISLLEALVGFEKSLPHLDSHKVVLSSSKVTKPGHVEEYKNEGMPKHGNSLEYGSLFVKYSVDFPSSITDEQAEGFRKLLAKK